MTTLLVIVVVATAVWVGADATSMQRRTGEKVGGINAFLWFLLCILLWVIAFPCYLVSRADALRGSDGSATLPPPQVLPPPPVVPPGWWLASDGCWYPPASQFEDQPPPPTSRLQAR